MDLVGINFSIFFQLLVLFILKCAMNLILAGTSVNEKWANSLILLNEVPANNGILKVLILNMHN